MQEAELNHFKSVKLYQLESEFIKIISGSFRFTVMYSSIYSKQREVITTFLKVFKVSNLASAYCFHKTLLIFLVLT